MGFNFKELKMAKETTRYKLTINSGESEGDQGDVVLIHNFRQIQIQRDVEVEVDACFVESCLKDAVITTAIRDENGKEVLDKEGNVKMSKVNKYSYIASPV